MSITGKTLERDAILNFHFPFVSNASSANPPPSLDPLSATFEGVTILNVMVLQCQLVVVVNKLMLVKKLQN